MVKNIKAITASSYLSMFFLGVASSLIGAAARNIGLTPYQIGLMIAVQNVGFGISVAISGALADTYQKPRLLLVGSLVLAASFFTFYLSDLFWLNLLIMLCIGAGIGVYEGVTDAMLLDLHTARAALHINVNHFFVTLGSIVIALYLIFLQMNWRQAIVQAGVVVLLLASFFGLTRLPRKDGPGESYVARFRLLVREKLVAVFFVGAVLAVGIEMGTIGILTTFLAELRGFGPIAARIGLVIFLAGMATGRVLIGYLSRKEQIFRILVTLFGLATMLLAALYFLDLGVWAYMAAYLAGVAISALLPSMLALAGLRYRGMSGTVLGAIKVGIPIGGILLPFLMSVVSQAASFQASLLIFPVAALVGFVLLLAMGER